MPKVIIKPNNYGWVLRNLKRFGNCYIKHLNKVDIPGMEEELNKEIIVRKTSKDCQGYILEVKKEPTANYERY